MTKKYWLQPENTKIGQGQRMIEQLTGSSTFCVLPWIHVATRPNGDMRLCCSSNASGAATGDHEVGLVKKENGVPANFGKESVVDAFNNKYMKSVRNTLLEGKIPASCTKCFEEEASGIVSKRLWEMYEWNRDELDLNELIDSTEADGTIPCVIRYFDLRLGNTCNLKCVMCSPHDSSRWMEDHNRIVSTVRSDIIVKQIKWDINYFNNKWYENPAFWDEIFEQIPNIRQLYFAGGEPLMIKEHRRFLEEIILRGYSKEISLRYNSNGLFINQEFIEIWSKFKKVKFNVSIDSLGERNHYIRYPSEWIKILEVLDILDDTPENISSNIEVTVQALNLSHLPDFAKFIIERRYKKINKSFLEEYQAGGGIFSMHLLYLPTFLSARILSKDMKKNIRKQYMEFKKWLWDNYRQDDDFWKHNPYGWNRWESILKFIESEDHSNMIPDFKEYLEQLDRIRNTKYKVIFPELGGL